MWEFVNGVTGNFSRRPPRRTSKAHMLPTLLIGAGVGIATWEVVKRRMAHTAAQESEHDDAILDVVTE
ncbi:MAG: hypothetical protein OWT28_03855 [Firmicutes bacterium]|nr:hypothetical protein [Bacillota bacterium]